MPENSQLEGRVALVVGNGKYENAPTLANPRHDADEVAALLRNMGWNVLTGIDVTRPMFEKKIKEFITLLQSANTGLLFYAGHGLQVVGKNYLIPVDAPQFNNNTDLRFGAFKLDDILADMSHLEKTSLIFLDACRNNPLARSLVAKNRSLDGAYEAKGLAQVTANLGTFIGYSTQPDNVAEDGDEGSNSPFTKALLRHMGTPDISIFDVMARVTREVVKETNHRQVPWQHSALIDAFYFKMKVGTPSGTVRLENLEEEYWEYIKNSDNVELFESYIKQFPNSSHKQSAEIRIKELKTAAEKQEWSKISEKNSVLDIGLFARFVEQHVSGMFYEQANKKFWMLSRRLMLMLSVVGISSGLLTTYVCLPTEDFPSIVMNLTVLNGVWVFWNLGAGVFGIAAATIIYVLVPRSKLTIPAVTFVTCIAWLCAAAIFIPFLDREFYLRLELPPEMLLQYQGQLEDFVRRGSRIQLVETAAFAGIASIVGSVVTWGGYCIFLPSAKNKDICISTIMLCSVIAFV